MKREFPKQDRIKNFSTYALDHKELINPFHNYSLWLSFLKIKTPFTKANKLIYLFNLILHRNIFWRFV